MKSNIQTRKLVSELRKTKAKVWIRVADELEKSTRKIVGVNVYKLNKYVREGEVAVVPGKVLGVGKMEKNITVVGFQFSESALSKIKDAVLLKDYVKKNPKGAKVRIIK